MHSYCVQASGLFTILEEGHSLLQCCSLVTVFLEFSLRRSAIDCLRGARSHCGCPVSHRALDLASSAHLLVIYSWLAF